MSYKKILYCFMVVGLCISPVVFGVKIKEMVEKKKALQSLHRQKTLNGRGKGLNISLAPGYTPQSIDQKIIKQLFNDILKNPEKIAEINHAYDSSDSPAEESQEEESQQEDVKIPITPEELTEFSQRAKNENNPIWSLEECKACTDLNRIINRKKEFIEQQTRSYALLHTDKTQPLKYTSIGSGQGLVDLVNLTHLVNEGYNTIEVRLIDTDYAKIIKRYTNIDFTDFDTVKTYYQMVQILEWFNIYLKQILKRDINITLTLYGNTDDYKSDYNQQNRVLKNDIFYAIDISLDWTKNESAGVNDIEWLINNTLSVGGWAFLFKDNDYIVHKESEQFLIEGFRSLDASKTTLIKPTSLTLETWISPTSPIAPIQSLGTWTVNTFTIETLIRKQFSLHQHLQAVTRQLPTMLKTIEQAPTLNNIKATKQELLKMVNTTEKLLETAVIPTSPE